MSSTEESPIEDEGFLEIKNLHLDFSVYQGTVQVLDGIELSMKRGEIFGVVGARAGIFIFFFVLGWQLLGDAFRDILNPKSRRGV